VTRRIEWLPGYVAALEAAAVRIPPPDVEALAPAVTVTVERVDWLVAAAIGAESGQRLVAVWGDPVAEGTVVRACFELGGNYLLLQTLVPGEDPTLPSMSTLFAGAGRLERHLRDLVGVAFSGAADTRRWARHRAWEADELPLRPDFPRAGHPPRRTPSDVDYPFDPIRGSGVYEIPVGPVHAGIIEPGHFRFQAVGEDVLRLEARLGYVHKGIEKIAVGRDAAGLARLASRVSGDSAVAHGWAACQAMERAAAFAVPARADHLRALLCERERVANHLGDIGAICNDVAFVFAHVQCARLREQWQRRSESIFGHRLLFDTVVPGGVVRDLTESGVRELREDHAALREAIEPLFDVVGDHPSLEDRLIGTGVLERSDAAALGCTGYVGKASGLAFDVRIDAPYRPYDRARVPVTVFADGDVAARVAVRMAEIRTSLDVLDALIDTLPAGPHRAAFRPPGKEAAGLGLVDGWRGEVMTFVRFDARGTIARFFPRDPSWLTWPALERLIHGNIVPDFPVCNKSVNASYAGHDL